LKINQAKNNGYDVDKDIESKVTSTIKDVESKISLAKNSSADKAFILTLELSEEISDSDIVTDFIKKYPPEPPHNLASKRIGLDVVLNWEKSGSTGPLEYVLVRKENSYPNSESDGNVIYRGKELSFTDAAFKTSTVYCIRFFPAESGYTRKQ